ncbi:MAG TPA: prepilin-type N-terminal cleavage/methylation domain-containing protein [Candidatus Paceibacterota bacterium]|nr:prepilin-type N-terminal cleavage/methylation domain-containing protein [Candidatus Paceibacterota bacterium]
MNKIRIRRISIRGFTLIELLVVIAIIGILASIILASLSTAKSRGRDSKRISDIKQIQLALELFYDANGYYPANIYTGSPSPLVSGGYISSMPTDPSVAATCTSDGTAGCYDYVGLCSAGGACTPTSYHLAADLELAQNTALGQDADACPGTSGNAGTLCASGNGTHDLPPSSLSTNGDFNGLSAVANSASNTVCNTTAGTPYPGTEVCFDVTP